MTELEVGKVAGWIFSRLRGRCWTDVKMEIEVQLMHLALNQTHHDCTAAAKRLGIKRTALVAKRRARGFPLNEIYQKANRKKAE